MKKLILVLLAAVAFSCGDGSNRSSERDNDYNDMDRETVEPDTTSNDQMESDTSSTWDQDRDDYNRQDSTRNQ